MRWLAVVAVCALALAGCKKKKPADPAPADPAPAVKADGLPSETPSPPSGNGGSGFIAGGAIGVVNPHQALGGGGGGSGIGVVMKAARRTQALNELKTLGELIELMRDEFGRMPTKERILTELRQTSPALFTAISEGSYILTGTTEGGGLWAFEVGAETTPGIAVIGGRAARTTPEQLQPYLAALPRRAVAPPQPPPMPMGKIESKQPVPAQPVAEAPVGRQDLDEIRLFIDNRSGATGQMPSVQETTAALKQFASRETQYLVQKGAITLVPARTREGVWAYQTSALQRGGWVTGANGTETVTADELRRRLGR